MRASSLRRDAVPLTVLVAVLAIACYGFFGQYAFDDSYVGYSIAQSLLLGHGFSFNGGDRVLSTSAPLAVPLYVLVSLVLRVSIVSAAQLCSAFALATIALGSYALLRRFATPLGALGGAITLTCTPFVLLLWSHETLLYAATTIVGLLLYARGRYTASALVLGAAALLRGEALLLLPIVWYAHLRARGTREALAFAGFSLAPYGLWAIGATLYFGTPFSQTVASKQAQMHYAAITPYFDGLRDYVTRMYAITPTRAWALVLELAVACTYAVALVCGLLRRVYVAAAVWTLATTALYVALHLPFYFWFCVQFAAFMAAGVAMLWPRGGTPRFALLLALGRTAAAAVVAINAGFLLLQLAQPQRKDISYDWIIMPSVRGNAYQSLARWFVAHAPPGASIAYAEFGQLHYYSGHPIVDFLGIVTPGAARHLARGDAIWTFERYRPDYVVETTNFTYFVDPTRYDWFGRAYGRVAALHFSGDPLRTHFVIYRLRDARRIPAAR